MLLSQRLAGLLDLLTICCSRRSLSGLARGLRCGIRRVSVRVGLRVLKQPIRLEGLELLGVILAVVRREGQVSTLLVRVLRLERSNIVLVQGEDVLREVRVNRRLAGPLGDLAALGELDRLAVLAELRLAGRRGRARKRIRNEALDNQQLLRRERRERGHFRALES